MKTWRRPTQYKPLSAACKSSVLTTPTSRVCRVQYTDREGASWLGGIDKASRAQEPFRRRAVSYLVSTDNLQWHDRAWRRQRIPTLVVELWCGLARIAEALEMAGVDPGQPRLRQKTREQDGLCNNGGLLNASAL
jgi:hypothetical protein